MQRMVIKGSEWNRAGTTLGMGMSSLLNEKGSRCCIGIHARICGVPDTKIMDQRSVVSMFEEGDGPSLPSCYKVWVDKPDDGSESDTEIAALAMTINDYILTTDAEKIAMLRPIFRDIGITIVWRPNL